ncbi:MAG: NAD(P)-dependent oxidoreductase [Verrucomicrobiales bacterium]|nr:NAD(P)-dependent oxidoreductase [Verrucomicrobiales bacterium]
MQSDGAEKVGVIGLGIIGNQVAAQLRESGRHVYVWNRTPKPEPNFVSSPAEVAKLSEVIHIFVRDGEALVEMVTAMKDELCKRHTIVNNCTADPESVVKAYQIAKEAGASFLDAPFTGSKVAAGKGALVYYIGGDPAVLEKVTPVLEASSKEILYLGRVGEATVLKIATNMITATTVEVLSEAYGLVTAAGINPDSLAQAIEHNACASILTGMKLPTIIERDYEPHFSLKNMFKDAQYALSLGKSLGVDLPAASTTANIMFRALKNDLGEKDFSVIAERFQKDEESDQEK